MQAMGTQALDPPVTRHDIAYLLALLRPDSHLLPAFPPLRRGKSSRGEGREPYRPCQ